MKNLILFDAPFGRIALAEQGGKITNLFLRDLPEVKASTYTPNETGILKEAARQLGEYFEGRRQAFNLSLEPAGTPFMQAVWQELLQIPFGETRSYQDIARNMGNPKACRAVGQANHRNPIPILIPCHRVIGSRGSLVGYGGGLEIKKFLLALEHETLEHQTL